MLRFFTVLMSEDGTDWDEINNSEVWVYEGNENDPDDPTLLGTPDRIYTLSIPEDLVSLANTIKYGVMEGGKRPTKIVH